MWADASSVRGTAGGDPVLVEAEFRVLRLVAYHTPSLRREIPPRVPARRVVWLVFGGEGVDVVVARRGTWKA